MACKSPGVRVSLVTVRPCSWCSGMLYAMVEEDDACLALAGGLVAIAASLDDPTASIYLPGGNVFGGPDEASRRIPIGPGRQRLD